MKKTYRSGVFFCQKDYLLRNLWIPNIVTRMAMKIIAHSLSVGTAAGVIEGEFTVKVKVSEIPPLEKVNW